MKFPESIHNTVYYSTVSGCITIPDCLDRILASLKRAGEEYDDDLDFMGGADIAAGPSHADGSVGPSGADIAAGQAGQDATAAEDALQRSIEADYAHVKGILGISDIQVDLLAAIAEISIGGTCTNENLARCLNLTNLQFISMMEDIDVLVDKRYVGVGKTSSGDVNYSIPQSVLIAFKKDEKPNLNHLMNLGGPAILRKWNKFLQIFWRGGATIETLRKCVFELIECNPENTMVKTLVGQYGLMSMDKGEQMIVIYALVRNFCFNDNSFEFGEYERLLDDSIMEDCIQTQVQEGKGRLFGRGFFEHDNNDGMVDTSHIRLTDKALKDILGVVRPKDDMLRSGRSFIQCSGIGEKKLFYNPEEGVQIDRLASLLEQENFCKVVARLQEKGFRSGFCCLLYGGPGTGKTESVYQIARRTGRDVFLVDVSEIKSKWVGDSEKNIRALFSSYKSIVKESEVAPILLFNEADAVFGIRKTGADSAVDKMENSIQNIILQEMEDFEGIMIATTNLTSNFDPAFERRFIYKVNLSKPGAEARAHIWESLVEGLSAGDAQVLASEYEFSGGQIENISRKMTVDYILSGVLPDLSGIRDLCKAETIAASSGRSAAPGAKIGFKRGA